MEQESYGNLFGTINLVNEQHIEAILTTMDDQHALYYLIESVKSAHKKGAFTIGETEVVSKSIRVLLRDPESK